MLFFPVAFVVRNKPYQILLDGNDKPAGIDMGIGPYGRLRVQVKLSEKLHSVFHLEDIGIVTLCIIEKLCC